MIHMLKRGIVTLKMGETLNDDVTTVLCTETDVHFLYVDCQQKWFNFLPYLFSVCILPLETKTLKITNSAIKERLF